MKFTITGARVHLQKLVAKRRRWCPPTIEVSSFFRSSSCFDFAPRFLKRSSLDRRNCLGRPIALTRHLPSSTLPSLTVNPSGHVPRNFERCFHDKKMYVGTYIYIYINTHVYIYNLRTHTQIICIYIREEHRDRTEYALSLKIVAHIDHAPVISWPAYQRKASD